MSADFPLSLLVIILDVMKIRLNPITTNTFRRSIPFAFAIIFFISAFSNAYAEPVRKDAALTQRYLERRSELSKDKEEKSEEAKRPIDAPDFWLRPTRSTTSSDATKVDKPTPETETNPWKAKTESKSTATEEQTPHLEMVTPYLEALRRWRNPPITIKPQELYDLRDDEKKKKEKGLALPLHSNLQITGHKSVTVELNKTKYFGQSDINRFGGSYRGGFSSGLDLGLTSSYSYDSYSSFGGGSGRYGSGGYGGGYGSGYGSGSGGFRTSSYGGVPRASGINIRQTLQVGLHGRVGDHTHVEVDYSDAGNSFGGGGYGGGSYGGYGGYSGGVGGAKQQKIRVWYEGGEKGFLKTLSFGDITLNLPNTRFLNVNRNLFGLEAVGEMAGVKMTAFGSRSKGISETRRFRGESRRAGFGRGTQIPDANYVKERFYFIQRDEDELLHDSYLRIKKGTEEIYIDDNVAGNNQGGQRTVQGYFNLQFPSQDYNINDETGEIEFLTPISASYKIVVAYEYLGDGGGAVGNPGGVFEDENDDGSIDEEGEEIGYVVLKDKSLRGTESRRVYNLGNRNISPRDYQITIFRQGGGEGFETPDGEVPYLQIFGLDENGDGIVDPEFIDFDRGLLIFPALRPFFIDDPNNPYFQFRDQLNNEAIYLENPRTTDQAYTIIADYAYRSETYNVGLFVIPGSETVRLNGRTLQRDIDYTMIYEVGNIRFFTQLDEFDEIEVEFERTPFGGALQQTVAGVWLEYAYVPKAKTSEEQEKSDRFDRLSGGGRRNSPGRGSGFGGRTSFGGSGSRYGRGGYGGGYSSLGGRSRRGLNTGGSTYFNPVFQKGFTLSTGYILNTGQKPSRIPDVNGAPNRLQAFNINTSFGRAFNLAWLLNPLPFLSVGNFPLSINFSGEAAFSHNNPNSVGVALIDSMEGARETSTLPTFKYNWRVCSSPTIEGLTPDNRTLFRVIPKDEDDSKAVGNYMRNREVPASIINPLAQSTEQRLIMEVGYDLTDVIEEWGGFSYGLSASGADFSDRESLEIWLRVRGDDDLTLYINLGVVSEDSDLDNRLDTEDLPKSLEDANGDGKIDTLDLDLENLPPSRRFSANGSLDTGEDEGWDYDATFQPRRVGADNKVLDTEDLNGDGVLDTIDAYLEIAIPLNDIPEEWVKRRNKNGWTFLSIPLRESTLQGSRLPNLGFVQHLRFWLHKNNPGDLHGIFEWASIEIVGNQWEQGIVTQKGNVVTDTNEKFTVATKDNFNFDDYQQAYDEIKNEKAFRKLHPFTDVTFGFQRQQREQTLTLNYVLLPESFGVTSQRLRGVRQGQGQDFSKHDKLKFWLYGDKSHATFVLRLAPSIRTSYRSTFLSSGAFDDPRQQQEEQVNIFENLKDFYEYTREIDFEGWQLIEIDLQDVKRNEYPDLSQETNQPTQAQIPGLINQPPTTAQINQTAQEQTDPNKTDGHPDGFVVRGTNSTQLSIKSVGGLLVGIRNDTEHEVGGEVWVNEIHLSDPLVRSGWARRANMSVELGHLFTVRGGFARQDRDFESSAGETGRQRRQDLGFSTISNDFNIDADLNLFRWLPISYAVREQENETESRRGSFSAFQSGKSKTHNRDFSARFNPHRFLPALGFAYNRQNFWNERRGTEISDLYTSTFRYDLGAAFGFDVQYRHEDVAVDPLTATQTAGGSSSSFGYGGYYGRNRDEKVDSGSISINISPVTTFSLNPTYEIRRELEKRDDNLQRPGAFRPSFGIPSPTTPTTTPTEPESPESEPEFTIAAREHRISLTPRLNRDFLGMRPTINNRISLRENWFRDQKDASIRANIRFGLSLRPGVWFGWLFREPEETEEDADSSEGVPDSFEEELKLEEKRQRDRERLERMGIDEQMIEEAESQKGDWINRDKAELDRKLKERRRKKEAAQAGRGRKGGIVRRSVDSLAMNADVSFDTQDSLRRLAPGMPIREILELPEEAEERTQSRRGRRYGFRGSVDPWGWASFGANVSLNNSFTKTLSTSSRSGSKSYEGDMKLFNTKNTSSFQVRYRYTLRDQSNVNALIGEATSQEPSISWSQTWGAVTKTALGVRITMRDQERSGIDSTSFIVTPNLSIDYRLRIESGFPIPFFGRRIALKHDLNLTNTFSTVIRREQFGANREERSERYETTLRTRYNLSTRLTANLNLGLSYNNDHIEEGRDFFSIASSFTMRGEFQ